MATQDDDPLRGPVPEADAEPTQAELAQARRFAELVDKTLAGRTPPAISADHRALIEVATVIRAIHGGAALAPERERAAIDQALRAPGIGEAGARRTDGADEPGVAPTARPRRIWPSAPWLVTSASALVAAAAVALWLHAPAPVRPRVAAPPAEWTSRPADSLIGPIARDHAGDAGARIDALFADRLDGFRTRRLARGGTP
jgi:hypothetical protein